MAVWSGLEPYGALSGAWGVRGCADVGILRYLGRNLNSNYPLKAVGAEVVETHSVKGSNAVVQMKALPRVSLLPVRPTARRPQSLSAQSLTPRNEDQSPCSTSKPLASRLIRAPSQTPPLRTARGSPERFGKTQRPVSTTYMGSNAAAQNPIPNLYSGTGPRLRVAVDVDEVLGRFVYKLNHFCKEKYDMDYDVSDYWIYEFAKIWGCTGERSNHIVHDFLASQIFTEGIPVIPGSFDALTRLSQTCDLVVVTSRQHVIQDVTLDWIDRHFEGLFQEVYFGNHFAMEGASRKKSEICKSIGAEVLIDDNPSYAAECAANGIHVLLYDWDFKYPWSKLPEGKVDPLITVVRDWEEAEAAIMDLVPKLGQRSNL
eukprot:gene11704-34432_t